MKTLYGYAVEFSRLYFLLFSHPSFVRKYSTTCVTGMSLPRTQHPRILGFNPAAGTLFGENGTVSFWVKGGNAKCGKKAGFAWIPVSWDALLACGLNYGAMFWSGMMK